MQVSEHIHTLEVPFQIPVRPGLVIDRLVYAYLIFGKEEVRLVDAGVAGSEQAIFDYVRRQGRDAGQITEIVHTHAHPDHIGATAAVRQATGCRVAIHEAERAWLENVQLQAAQRPVPGFDTLVGGSAPVDRVLRDGDVLALDDKLTVKVLHTPGHSPGSISLWIERERTLIAGDAIPLAGAMPIYDHFRAAVRSVRRLMDLDDVDILLSSWDAPRKRETRKYLEAGLDYLRSVHEVVHGLAREEPSLPPPEFCRWAVARLGLPESAANPLVAKALQSTLAVPDAEARQLFAGQSGRPFEF